MRAPSSATTIWSGEVDVPRDLVSDQTDTVLTLEPRTDSPMTSQCAPSVAATLLHQHHVRQNSDPQLVARPEITQAE